MIELLKYDPIIQLIISVLAAYRVSFMLVEEEGFLNISAYIKYIFGTRWEILDKDVPLPNKLNPLNLYKQNIRNNINQYIVKQNSEFAHALDCIYCTSIWIGVLITVMFFFLPEYSSFILLPFALSTTTIIIDNKF